MLTNMIYYEKFYEVEYTWRYVDSNYYYTESRTFITELESNKFILELKDNPNIEVVRCKQSFYRLWEK